jgi:hypothetical protein
MPQHAVYLLAGGANARRLVKSAKLLENLSPAIRRQRRLVHMEMEDLKVIRSCKSVKFASLL